MTSIEYLYSRYSEYGYISQKTYLLSIEIERNQIIRAVNYSVMKLDKMRAEAIKQNITIGELYIKMNKDENNDSKNNPRT